MGSESDFAEQDFIEYWSAFNLAQRQQGAYDPQAMLLVQNSIRPTNLPLMMWNPPWLLSFYAPVLRLPFHQSARAFLFLHLAFLGGAFFLGLRTISSLTGKSNSTSRTGLIVLFALSCPVFWHAVYLGQIGPCLALASALFFYGLEKESNWFSALGLVLFTLKPHLFHLILIAVLFLMLRKRNWRIPLYTTGLLVAWLLLTELFFPGLLLTWLDLQIHPQTISGVTVPLQWLTPTIVGVLRSSFPESLWPWLVVPAVEIGLVALIVFSKVRLDSTFLLALLPVALITAPFAWGFDYLACLPAYLVAVTLAIYNQRRDLLILLLVLNLLGWFYIYVFAQQHLEIFYYLLPFVLLLTYLFKSEVRPAVTGR